MKLLQVGIVGGYALFWLFHTDFDPKQPIAPHIMVGLIMMLILTVVPWLIGNMLLEWYYWWRHRRATRSLLASSGSEISREIVSTNKTSQLVDDRHLARGRDPRCP